MFRLLSLTASTLTLVTMLLSHSIRAASSQHVAQSVSTDSVTALMLTAGDLPGWSEASINAQANSNNGQGFA